MPLLGFTQFIPKIITGLTRQEITEQARQYLLDHCKEAEPGSPLEYAMRLTFTAWRRLPNGCSFFAQCFWQLLPNRCYKLAAVN